MYRGISFVYVAQGQLYPILEVMLLCLYDPVSEIVFIHTHDSKKHVNQAIEFIPAKRLMNC